MLEMLRLRRLISSDNCGQSGGKFYCRSCVAKRGGPAGASPGAGGGAKSQASEAKASSAGGAAKPAASGVATPPNPDRPGATFVAWETLKGLDVEACKSRGIDFASKENWLSPSDFGIAFPGLDRAGLAALPAWKRQRLKKNAGLQ